MPRVTVTVNFKNPAIKSATLVIRKRPKKTGPPQDPAQAIPGESHPMMDKGGGTFSAQAVPLPAPGAGNKLLLRIYGKDMQGISRTILDAPVRNHPPKKDGKKELKKGAAKKK